MTKTELKKKTKDELIEIVEKQEETIKKLMDGKFIPETVGKMFVKSLDEKEQEVRHDICEKFRVMLDLNTYKTNYISELHLRVFIEKVERGKV